MPWGSTLPHVPFDFIHTVASGGVVLFVGHLVRRLLRALARYNVPAPVIGGLPVIITVCLNLWT